VVASNQISPPKVGANIQKSFTNWQKSYIVDKKCCKVDN